MAVPPPHLVHVFATFAPHDAQIRTAGLINHFGARFRHTIVTMDRHAGARALIRRDLDVGVVGPPEPGRLLPVRFAAIRSWLKLLQPDLIVTYGAGGPAVALADPWGAIAPRLHHEDDGDDGTSPGGRLRRLARASAHRVLVPARALERIASRSWGLAPEKVCYVPNGVNVEGLSAAPARDAVPGLERRPGELIVGTVSAFRRVDNLARLVRVFAMCRDREAARLVIVGDGPMRGELIRAIVEHDLESRVVLPGDVPGVENCLGLFDVFALSSDAATTPLGLMQAMAAGLPVVGTDVGDVRDMVSEPNRDFVVPRDNEAAFAARLDGLLRDGQTRTRLGRANRAKALHAFRFEVMAEAWAAIVDDALRGCRAGLGTPESVP